MTSQPRDEKEKEGAAKEVNRCKGCGYEIHPSEQYCGECLCEDDC